MLTIEKLKEFGANTDEGISRCMGNEEFYLKVVKMMLDDNAMDKLKAALDENDLDKAFEAAHSLKGVTGNLSMTPISEPTIEITELLRARTQMDYSDLFEKISTEWDKLKA
ncbi:MAG: Hpt domain-containing protein, partial [Parasporobacterium sp.]|nr:Hpt domain-containing protein [Parasporobacterium sp.]